MKLAVSVILIAGLILGCTISGFSQAEPELKLPVLPVSGKKIGDFVPSGWRLIKSIKGDLNNDRFPDCVAVIQQKGEQKNLDEAHPRILFILFQEPEGGAYRLSLQSGRAILLSNEGGIQGDPFQGLFYERGTFVILFYGGSRIRWEYGLRFRFQDNGWFLIGFTKTITDSGSGQGETKDYNLLTGKYIITKKSHEEINSSVSRKRQRRKLVNLNDFVASDIEILNY